MADNEDYDDDLFADVYGEEAGQAPSAPPAPVPKPAQPVPSSETVQPPSETTAIENDFKTDGSSNGHGAIHAISSGYGDDQGMGSGNDGYQYDQYQGHDEQDENEDDYGPIGIKEDG